MSNGDIGRICGLIDSGAATQCPATTRDSESAEFRHIVEDVGIGVIGHAECVPGPARETKLAPGLGCCPGERKSVRPMASDYSALRTAASATISLHALSRSIALRSRRDGPRQKSSFVWEQLQYRKSTGRTEAWINRRHQLFQRKGKHSVGVARPIFRPTR